jgi:hypothetical protein
VSIERDRARLRMLMLLAAAAAAAVVIVTLLNASPLLVAAVATFCFAVYGAAALAAVYRRGSGGAFTGGFLIAGVGYLLLVNWLAHKDDYTRTQLLTTDLLDRSHALVARTIPDPYFTGGGIAGGLTGGGGGAMPPILTPRIAEFRELGEYYWSLLLGLVGGVLARRFHVLRTGERNASPRAESP